MKLLEAVTYLRENILDDIGGLNLNWASFTEDGTDSLQLRWTNEELVSNINEAMNQVYRRILPVKESNPDFNITSSIGQSEYSLNNKILNIQGMRSSTTGLTLERIDIEDLWNFKDLRTKVGAPTKYIPNYDTGSITLYPQPSASDTYNILAYRLPISTLNWDYEENIIELREEFIIPMLWFAASLSYDKDEANTLDPNRSVYFLQKFNQEFVPTSAYSDVRKRRTSNRSIRYGGL